MTELTTQETKEPYGKDFWTAIKGTWDSLNSLALAIVNAIYDAHPTEDVKKKEIAKAILTALTEGGDKILNDLFINPTP